MNTYKHTTVFLNEAIDNLNIYSNGNYIDVTFGQGGHSRRILSKLGKNGRLIAIDRDPDAINSSKIINDSRFSIIHGPFSRIKDYVNNQKLIGKINGIIVDLGVSSLQLDNAERGFSFMKDGPLDMRMNPTEGKSVAEWLKIAKEKDISWILKNFGEERFAKRIAHSIIEYRDKYPITRTMDLVKIIELAIPKKDKFKHFATRTFQALRIWINNELKEIELMLKNSLNVLAPKGRLSIISFHSLEDRIVKRFIYDQSHGPKIPFGMPITEEQRKKIGGYHLIEIGKFIPNKTEILNNPRARSSILRIAERTDT